MGLEASIKSELWAAVERSYLSENYSHAIKDAMSFVTDIIRDKSGLDGDGDSLVGQALGFDNSNKPKLMINSLQTQTEKDMQRGLMFTLKGLYALVRNPRSHERTEDSKKTADTVIRFIDYLTDFLGTSQQSFTVQGFLSLVTDAHFVRDDEYVMGLVDSIPARKRTDTLIAVYRDLNWKQANNFEAVIKRLLSKLNAAEKRELLSVLSEDLQTATRPADISLIIKILPSEMWTDIDRMARLRAENMLLDELKKAWYIPDPEKTNSVPATWISRIAGSYIRKKNLQKVILAGLNADDFDKHNFIAKYLMLPGELPSVFESEDSARNCVKAIASSIRAGNAFVKDSLVAYIQETSPPGWYEMFLSELEDLTDHDNPEIRLADGVPFLGKFEEQPNPATEAENKIPF